MKHAEALSLAGGGLDRQTLKRKDAATLMATGKAKALPLWRGRPLVTGAAGDAPRLAFLAPDHPFLSEHAGQAVFLGTAPGEGPLFAVDASAWHPASAAVLDVGPGLAAPDQPLTGYASVPAEARFADFRALFPDLSPLEAEIVATAKGVLGWHRSHPFCAACGTRSEARDGGWLRHCPACGARHFPRTDPVVIMLVTRGNDLLIGRSPGWPEGFYSLLAGFLEPGETVAQAVRREVAEETGVTVGAVRLLSSQPWPFPASLMIGCIAEAETAAIRLDPAELDEAFWISREDLLAVFAGTHAKIRTPRRGAIAHFLLKMWLADRLD